MATVVTYKSEDELDAALGGAFVQVAKSEEELQKILDNPPFPVEKVLAIGGQFTVIAGTSVPYTEILAKGRFYTVIFP